MKRVVNLPLISSLTENLKRLTMATASAPAYINDSPLSFFSYPYMNLCPRYPIYSSGCVNPFIGKDGFQVSIDVGQFMPNELSVKVLDKSVLVEGKHDEREDDQGHISLHFVRRYALPKGYEEDKVVSTLSSDGVLTVSVPKPLEDKSSERVIQIQNVGPAHLHIKENAQEEVKESDKKTTMSPNN